MRNRFLLTAALVCLSPLVAQDNYEIQVYGSETIAPKKIMFETHTNFTFSGSRLVENGVIPTHHAIHETIEITRGFNSWFETGFYVFTSYNPGYGYQWVGDHIRPRVRAPESWKLPVGLSLSAEFGYQRAAFSEDTWTMELRPIIDKQLDRWYLCFNPTVGRAFHGPGTASGVSFSPNVKVAYKLAKRVDFGVEYYGNLGEIGSFDPFRNQSQQFIPTFDLDLGPEWEFNAGLGVGVTHNTDHLILKLIVGRRFGRK